MAVYKNKASQKAAVYAYDPTTGEPVSGDAANITAQISKDGGATAATNDVNPTELDAADAPGVYLFDLTQSESNADLIIIAAVSATADVLLETLIIYTEPESVAQTGDNYAVVNSGTHGNAALKLLIEDVPTVSEFNARTLGAADYFDPASDAVANVTNVGTVTTLTNLPAMPTDWITSAGFSAAAVAKIEAALINEGDGQALVDAIVQAIDAADIDTDILPALIRDAILNRVLAGNHDTVGTVGKFIQQLDAAISTRLAPQTAGRTLIVSTAGDANVDLQRWRGVVPFSLQSQLVLASSSLPVGAVGAAQLTVGAIDAIQAGLATEAQLTDVEAVTDTLLARIPAALFSGITSLAQWLGLIAGKQTGDATARTELRATGVGGGTFLETDVSLEAIRDRGDAAWTGGGGGGGGGGPIIITPVTSTVSAGEVTSGHFEAYTAAAGSADLVIADAAGDPIDLTGVDLDFIVERKDNRADHFVKQSPDDVTGGDGVTTVEWDAADFTAAGVWLYALRQRDTGRVWARGTVTVEWAPTIDA